MTFERNPLCGALFYARTASSVHPLEDIEHQRDLLVANQRLEHAGLVIVRTYVDQCAAAVPPQDRPGYQTMLRERMSLDLPVGAIVVAQTGCLSRTPEIVNAMIAEAQRLNMYVYSAIDGVLRPFSEQESLVYGLRRESEVSYSRRTALRNTQTQVESKLKR
jgi:hypothetical protein